MFLFAAALYWSVFQPQLPAVAQTRMAILAVTATICATWWLIADMPPAHSPQWIQAIAEAFVITFIFGCGQVFQKQYNHRLSQTLAIQRALEQTKAAAQGKGDLLRVLSHELRTPLNGVLGMAELMRLGPLTPAQAQQVEAIRDAGQRLTALVTNVLDSEQLERGGLRIIKTPTDVTGMLHRVHDRFRQAADAQRISLICEHDRMPEGNLVIDPVRVEQVLVRLVSNAVKHTAQGGVVIRAEHDAGAHPPQLTVSVIDTGCGLSAAQLKTLFDPLSPSDMTETRAEGGIGLGMWMAQQLAGLMGGAITVSSTPGLGARFDLKIIADVAAESSAQVKLKHSA